MPKMLSLRNYRLATKAGPIMVFKAKEPRDVPGVAVPDALAAGCAMVDISDQPFFDNLGTAKVSFGGDVRKSLLFLACRELAKENDAKKFTAGGLPRVPAVEALTGFDTNAKEITEAYQQVTSHLRNGEEFQLHPSAENALKVIQADGREDLSLLAMEMFDDAFNARLEGLQTRDIRTAMLQKLAAG